MPVKDISVLDRGSFFDDSFFRESWDDFDRAMRQVLDRFDSSGIETKSKSRPECQDIYRQIRANKIDDDIYTSQALQITERNGNFQVVIDVRDFNPRNLQVKVVDEKVILEGRYDKVSEDGKSSSSKAFYREFLLPVEADIDKISTALSKDGVLTIRTPRKEGIPASIPQKNIGNASRVIQNAINDHKLASSRSDCKLNSSQPASHLYTSDYCESLHKDVKDRLIISDKDSGRSSCSVSPIPSGHSNLSSCTSPAPSEASSEASRYSSNSDFQKKNSSAMQMSDTTFKVDPSLNMSNPKMKYSFSDNGSNNSFDSYSSKILENSNKIPLAKSSAAVGSGGTASFTVKEEDGRKTLTSEKSSLVQQRDGFLESKEISAEVSGKDSQAARREALTRMMKTEEDPEGRFCKSEKADASDISESCVQHLPDGSVVSVKKNSTSTSNFKQFVSSSGGPGSGFFESEFPSTFRSMSGMQMPSLLNRGGSMHSQRSSTDSMGSNISSLSNFSNSSRFSDMSHFGNMSDSFHNSDPFASRVSNFSNFPAFSSLSDASLFNSGSQIPQTQDQNSRVRQSFSSSSQSSYSSFDNSKK